MSFDVNPLDDNPDPHGECRHEIQRLQKLLDDNTKAYADLVIKHAAVDEMRKIGNETGLPSAIAETVAAVRLAEVIKLMDAGKLQAAYNMATRGVEENEEGSTLALTAQVKTEQFAAAFNAITDRFQYPACWAAFGEVPGMGTQMMMGGNQFAQQLVRFRMGLGDPPPGYQVPPKVKNPNEMCVECGGPIPPGRAGRQCKKCLDSNSRRPGLILPPSIVRED